MKRSMRQMLWLSILSIIVLLVNPTPSRAFTMQPQVAPKFQVRYITPDAAVLPDAVREALAVSLNAWTGSNPDENTFSVVSVRWENDWSLLTLTSVNLYKPRRAEGDTYLSTDSMFTALVVKTGDEWKGAIETDSKIVNLLTTIPNSELSSISRQALFPSIVTPSLTNTDPILANSSYKFPWASNQQWRLTNGWHDSYTWGNQFPANTSLDFDIIGGNGSNADILASTSGTVTYRCTTGVDDQAFVYVTTDGTSEKLGYLHLSRSSLQVSNGTHVNQGQVIGRMASLDNGSGGTTPPSGSCAASVNMRTHLHVYFPYKPFAMEGVTFSQDVNSLPWNTDLNSSQGQTSQPTCPTSGGVILYRDPINPSNSNASCGGKGDGEGWVLRNSAGSQSMPSGMNKLASSVRVPSGWSVKLYPDNKSVWACRTADDPMFWGQKMNDSSTNLDDNITSFEVFTDNRCGVNNPPNTPATQSPGDNSTATDGRGPTLCWNNPGDP